MSNHKKSETMLAVAPDRTPSPMNTKSSAIERGLSPSSPTRISDAALTWSYETPSRSTVGEAARMCAASRRASRKIRINPTSGSRADATYRVMVSVNTSPMVSAAASE